MNKEIKNSCIKHSNNIQQIFLPLFNELNIHGFSFHRIYKNEERIFLSNSAEWIDNYFLNDYFSIQGFRKYLNLPKYLLWTKWPENDLKACQLIKNAADAFDYGNALSVHRQYESYIDIFSLRGFAKDIEVNYRYISYLDQINKFLDLFLINYQKEIHKLEQNKIIIAENCNNPLDLNLELNVTNLNNIIHPETGELFLTKRELDCLKGLAKGKTAKQIAYDLNISFRTVEQYLNCVKEKLGLHYKSEVLEKLFSVDSNKRYILDLHS